MNFKRLSRRDRTLRVAPIPAQEGGRPDGPPAQVTTIRGSVTVAAAVAVLAHLVPDHGAHGSPERVSERVADDEPEREPQRQPDRENVPGWAPQRRRDGRRLRRRVPARDAQYVRPRIRRGA